MHAFAIYLPAKKNGSHPRGLTANTLKVNLYPERDLNPHNLIGHRILSPACLPIPPSGRPEIPAKSNTAIFSKAASGSLHEKRDCPFPEFKKKPDANDTGNVSGKRGSNSRPQPWQGCALPAELLPRNRIAKVHYFF